jgi:hypothetical protein
LGFWVGLRDAGQSLTQIANEMYATAPARDYYPLFLTNQEIIASFYVNVLGRTADAEGLAFWTAKLNAAGATPGSVITQMIDVVAHYAGTNPAGLTSQALFNNKVEVAQFYGEHNGNIDDAATVLATVTADHATVVTAEAAITAGTIGQDGIDVTLTINQDAIAGSPANDLVHGTFGSGAGVDTYTAGDSIDLGLGSQDQLALTVTGGAAAAAIVVKNTEVINIQDTIGGTFNALLVENTPAINVTNTLTGQTTTINGAALGSVMGLAGKGNLTVDYLTTTGTADTAKVSLNTVGTSATVRSTVNVSDANTVEKVTIATAGTNFVTLTAGTAASSITVTGSGTNNFDMSAAGATAPLTTVDASASTGANTFVMGATLGGGDTVKGGTAADTVSSAFTAAALINPTMSSVETWTVGSYGAAAVMDLANTDGLGTINVTTSAANMQVINADSGLTAFNLSALTVADSTLKVGYTAADKGNLALKIGTATSGAVDLGAVTLTNTNSVSITTVGAFVHDADNVSIAGNQTALSINVGAGGDFTPGDVTVTGNIDALSLTVGAASYYSGGIYAVGNKNIGPVTVAVGNGGEINQWIEVQGKGNIGDYALTATGNNTVTDGYLYADHGNVGNITIDVNGNGGSGYLGVTASGGTVGDISVSLNGDNGHYGMDVSAGDWEGAGSGGSTAGAIGDISVTMTGDSNSFSGDFNVSGGDVGNITVSIDGNDSSAGLTVYATYEYRDNAAGDDEYQFGGNIGDISISVNGDSKFSGFFGSSGGTVGNVSVVADHGAYVSLQVDTAANGWYSGAPANQGDIGNVGIFVGANSAFSGGISGGANIGNVAVVLDGANASGGLGIYANQFSGVGELDSTEYAGGGNVGHVSVDINGDNASWYMYVDASGGDINGVDWSMAGNGASGFLDLSAQRGLTGSTGGDIGAVVINIGSDTDAFELNMNYDGAASLTVVAGDDTASGNFYISGGSNSDNTNDASLDFVNITYGENANTWFDVGNFSGSVGAVAVTYGDNSSAGFEFSGITGSVTAFTGHFGNGQDFALGVQDVDGGFGPTSLTFGTDAHFWIGMSGSMPTVGAITVAGGDSTSSGGINVDTAIFGGVDASAWLGELTVDLTGVTLGTQVKVGAAGSDVIGTEGGDNVFLGAGVDLFHFDATPTAVDTLYNFKVGTGGDQLDLIQAATVLETTLTANGAMVGDTGDIVRLVDIAGNQNITTEAGLITALEAGGEYATVSETAGAAFTIVTAASATSNQLYVFNVVDTNANATFETGEVVLVGIVNLTTAAGPAGLVLGNFV